MSQGASVFAWTNDAFSRVTSRANVTIKILDTETQGKLKKDSDAIFTRNVVYKEIL